MAPNDAAWYSPGSSYTRRANNLCCGFSGALEIFESAFNKVVVVSKRMRPSGVKRTPRYFQCSVLFLATNFWPPKRNVPWSTVVFFCRGTVPIDTLKDFPVFTDIPHDARKPAALFKSCWSPAVVEAVRTRSSAKAAAPNLTPSISAPTSSGSDLRSLSTIVECTWGQGVSLSYPVSRMNGMRLPSIRRDGRCCITIH